MEFKERALDKNPVSRNFPNSVGCEMDDCHCECGYISYYAEDVEKMKNMSREEQITYKRTLREQKRYRVKNNQQEIK